MAGKPFAFGKQQKKGPPAPAPDLGAPSDLGSPPSPKTPPMLPDADPDQDQDTDQTAPGADNITLTVSRETASALQDVLSQITEQLGDQDQDQGQDQYPLAMSGGGGGRGGYGS